MSQTWDSQVSLLTPDGFDVNQVGDEVPKYKLGSPIFCYELPISRSEFYMAGQANIEISKLIVIHPYEYDNQKIVAYEGEQYSVIKSYKANNEELELTLKQKMGG